MLRHLFFARNFTSPIFKCENREKFVTVQIWLITCLYDVRLSIGGLLIDNVTIYFLTVELIKFAAHIDN